MGSDLIWSPSVAVEMYSQLRGACLRTNKSPVNTSCIVATCLLRTSQKPGFPPSGHLSSETLYGTTWKLANHGSKVSVAVSHDFDGFPPLTSLWSSRSDEIAVCSRLGGEWSSVHPWLCKSISWGGCHPGITWLLVPVLPLCSCFL